MKYWDKAWSIISGCTPVSPACDNCWLAGMEYRFDRIPGLLQVVNGVREPKFGGNIICHPDRLDIPLKTKKPTVFAVWSDLFHPFVSADFIIEAFERMEHCEQHTFLVLTKRPERLESVLYGQEGKFYLGGGDYIPNVWLGTTVENQEMADKRIPELLKCRPFNLFLSIEPMLSKIDLRLTDIYFVNRIFETNRHPIGTVIVGCESGYNARETKIEWIRDLRNQCLGGNVPLWVKQLKVNGKMVYNHPLSTIEVGDLWNA